MAKHRDEGGAVGVGDTVRIKHGTACWLRECGHWADFICREIDGMTGIVIEDLTWLGGENARFRIDLGFQHPVSVPAQFVEKASYAA